MPPPMCPVYVQIFETGPFRRQIPGCTGPRSYLQLLLGGQAALRRKRHGGREGAKQLGPGGLEGA